MLTLARKTELGIQPRVQYEVKTRVEWQPPQQHGTAGYAEEAAARAVEKLSVDENDVGMVGVRGSPDGQEDQDIIQGRTFKMLQKVTDNPEGASWPFRLSPGGRGDGGNTKSSSTSPALSLNQRERQQQSTVSSIRKPIVEVKAMRTEQTSILMSDEPAAPASRGGSETHSSQVEIPSKNVSLSASSFSVSRDPVTTSATKFTVCSAPASGVPKSASFDLPSQHSSQQVTTQRRSLSPSTTKHSRISEEISPWLQKSDSGDECQISPKPSASKKDVADDDDVQPIRQGRTFRLLNQATTTNPSADAYKAVFEEGKLSRVQKK